MNIDKIKYLVLSDIHLGHNLNKTENIVENLRRYFRVYHKEFKTLNLICIAGDIFDKLLVTSSKDFILSTEWLTELILFCKKNNIKLRILEGTPSHDWKQAKVISSIIEKLQIEIDYKYIDTLFIEKMIDWDISILYIPDEYKHKASDTYKEVRKLLKENKLSKVDIAFIHGQFHYQLPMVQLESSHTEKEYLDIVKYYISVGHIHTHSIYERILAQGSFDRLAHNEEENKGGMLINIFKNGDMNFQFLPNNRSLIFKTIRFDNEDLEEIKNKLNETLKDIPEGSHIRLVSEHEEFFNKNLVVLKNLYPNYIIKIEKPKKKESKFKLITDVKHIDSFAITRENIIELLDKELVKYNLTEKEIKIYKDELNTIMSKI